MPPPNTPIRSIATDKPDPVILDEAAAILRGGGLVAFATETVYGLGADATQPDAVARIFEAKGRPSANPLIVHACDVAMVRDCVSDWPETAERLAERFWPGPLTLVLPRSALIPEIVAAGGPTVGVRIPQPAVARGLIARLGRPIAAPSANRSNAISPTTARHVAATLDGRIDLILDSGSAAVGLESTVLDLSSRRPRILRPGPITARELDFALGRSLHVHDFDPASPATTLRSPGQMAVHYAPRTRAVWVEPEDFRVLAVPDRSALLSFAGFVHRPGPTTLYHYHLKSPEHAAESLYSLLHACDRYRLDLIVVVPPPDRPEWQAIRDRLSRATTQVG